MVGTSRSEDTLHPAGKSVGERLQRKLQRLAQRRTTKSRDLLLAEGSTNTERTVAEGVQNDSSTQLTWIPAANTGDNKVEASRRTNIASDTGSGDRLNGLYNSVYL